MRELLNSGTTRSCMQYLHHVNNSGNTFSHIVNVADVTRNRFVSDILLNSKDIGK